MLTYIEFLAVVVIMSKSTNGEVKASGGCNPRGVSVFKFEEGEYVESCTVTKDTSPSKNEQVVDNLKF